MRCSGFVDADGAAVERHGLLEVLVADVLVPAQRVRVPEGRVDLDGPLEELERGLVLLL